MLSHGTDGQRFEPGDIVTMLPRFNFLSMAQVLSGPLQVLKVEDNGKWLSLWSIDNKTVGYLMNECVELKPFMKQVYYSKHGWLKRMRVKLFTPLWPFYPHKYSYSSMKTIL